MVSKCIKHPTSRGQTCDQEVLYSGLFTFKKGASLYFGINGEDSMQRLLAFMVINYLTLPQRFFAIHSVTLPITSTWGIHRGAAAKLGSQCLTAWASMFDSLSTVSPHTPTDISTIATNISLVPCKGYEVNSLAPSPPPQVLSLIMHYSYWKRRQLWRRTGYHSYQHCSLQGI